MSNDIVVVGSCNIDFFCYSQKLPVPGETIHGTKFVTGFGGKGANQCIAAAKLGGNTTFLARLGDDHWGITYKEKLEEYKVNTSFIQITEGETSGIAQISVDEQGQNQIVIIGGANNALCPNDILNAKDVISRAKVLVMQLETPIPAAMQAMDLCNGISILNGAPAIAKADCFLLKKPTIFCVNETEASVFSDLPVNNRDEAKTALVALLKKCNSVLLTLGSDGALYASREKPDIIHITTPSVKAVDTTGAGDSFIGALAYLLANHSDLSMEKCIELSCQIAAISVTSQGTHPSYPDQATMQDVLSKMK